MKKMIIFSANCFQNQLKKTHFHKFIFKINLILGLSEQQNLRV
jgi:hypothetical protein